LFSLMTRARITAAVTAAILPITMAACRQPHWQRDSTRRCDTAIAYAWDVAAHRDPGAPFDERLFGGLTYCGRKGTETAGAIFASQRASSDTAWLQSLAAYTSGANVASLLDPMLEVAEDKRASDIARVIALVSVSHLIAGRYYTSYRDFIGGFDQLGFPARGCGSGKLATDQPDPPKPSTEELAKSAAVAERVRADSASSIDVRTAAACTAELIPRSNTGARRPNTQ